MQASPLQNHSPGAAIEKKLHGFIPAVMQVDRAPLRVLDAKLGPDAVLFGDYLIHRGAIDAQRPVLAALASDDRRGTPILVALRMRRKAARPDGVILADLLGINFQHAAAEPP